MKLTTLFSAMALYASIVQSLCAIAQPAERFPLILGAIAMIALAFIIRILGDTHYG